MHGKKRNNWMSEHAMESTVQAKILRTKNMQEAKKTLRNQSRKDKTISLRGREVFTSQGRYKGKSSTQT